MYLPCRAKIIVFSYKFLRQRALLLLLRFTSMMQQGVVRLVRCGATIRAKVHPETVDQLCCHQLA